MKKAMMASAVLLSVSGVAHAGDEIDPFVEIGFVDSHNFLLQDLHSPYPQGQDIELGGVRFDIPKDVPQNIWLSDPTLSADGDLTLEIETGVDNVDGVHFLMNTILGENSVDPSVKIEFISFGVFEDGPGQDFAGLGFGDLVFTKELFGNDDLRSYLNTNGIHTDTINGTTTQEVFLSTNEQIRLDKVFVDLPSSFNGRTLDLIRVVDKGSASTSRVFVGGVTAQLVPAPGSAVLLGLSGLLVARRRRS